MTRKALQRLARLERGKGGLAQIGGILLEWIERPDRRLHALPKLAVCGSSKRITIVGRLAPLQIGSLDLIRSWPEIAQIDVAPIGGLTQQIVLDVNIDRTCDCIGNDERWRCKEPGREQRMNPAREIAIARKHGDRQHTMIMDRLFHRLQQRTGIADAGHAAEAY